MLYSTRMDRGGSSGQVTELFQGALKKDCQIQVEPVWLFEI